jgi:hypothetical protein
MEMCSNPDKKVFTTAFVDTGFLLAKDGSENGLVNLQGWVGPNKYDF